jgi:hypothetical protein
LAIYTNFVTRPRLIDQEAGIFHKQRFTATRMQLHLLADCGFRELEYSYGDYNTRAILS